MIGRCSAKEVKRKQATTQGQELEGTGCLLGSAGLLESCSPSLTGSREEGRGWEGGVKRGRMEGKVMRRPGECLEEPTLAMPAPPQTMLYMTVLS